MRRVFVLSLTVALGLSLLTPTQPAAAQTLQGRPGAARPTGPVFGNGLDASLTNPGLVVAQSPRRAGGYQQVCARSRLFRGQATSNGWALVTSAPPVCRSIAPARRRTTLPGALFIGLARDLLYGTDTALTWRTRSGTVLGRASVDFSRAGHYSCLPLGGCTITANAASSHGIVFTAPPTPAPTTPAPAPAPAPVSPPAAAPYPYPGNTDPGGYPESSDSGAGYAITGGAFTCAGGAISVSAPEFAATNFVGAGSVDYYRDYLWWWDTSTGTWRFWKAGPIQSRTRGGGWVDLLTGRAAPGPSVYPAQPGFSYGVTQQVGDGYTRASHDVSATSLTGAGAPYCVL